MKIIAILAAAAFGLTATAGFAQSSKTVRFTDLDVTSAAGRSLLNHRIANAADSVCGMTQGRTDLVTHINARNCRAQAVAMAMKDVAIRTAPQFASR